MLKEDLKCSVMIRDNLETFPLSIKILKDHFFAYAVLNVQN